MKRTIQWLFFLICVGLFAFFRMRTHHEPSVNFNQEKPQLLQPTVLHSNQLSHPWLQLQPKVTDAAVEIGRDVAKIKELSHSLPGFTEEELTQLIISKLQVLQQQIPITFAEELYNVLCIPEPNVQGPRPFRIVKRLYLGESELGLPFYLDVRQFELEDITADELMAWHLETLQGTVETLFQSEERMTYLCKGSRNLARDDTTHGFAALQGTRGLFLDFVRKDDSLFVCYAEAPLKLFHKYEDLFRNALKSQK